MNGSKSRVLKPPSNYMFGRKFFLGKQKIKEFKI